MSENESKTIGNRSSKIEHLYVRNRLESLEETMVDVLNRLFEAERRLAGVVLHTPRGRTQLTARKLADYLNRLFQSDPAAITSLLLNRERCNSRLADDPQCIVDNEDPERPRVGILGILNGLLDPDDDIVGYEFDVDDGVLIRFFTAPKPSTGDPHHAS